MITMPRWTADARDDIIALQRRRATKTRYSRSWRPANRQVAKTYSTASRRADNWARETANTLVAAHDVIVLEDLNLVAMTPFRPRDGRGAREQRCSEGRTEPVVAGRSARSAGPLDPRQG